MKRSELTPGFRETRTGATFEIEHHADTLRLFQTWVATNGDRIKQRVAYALDGNEIHTLTLARRDQFSTWHWEDGALVGRMRERMADGSEETYTTTWRLSANGRELVIGNSATKTSGMATRRVFVRR